MKNILFLSLTLLIFTACHKKISDKTTTTQPATDTQVVEATPSVNTTSKGIKALNIPEGVDSNLVISLQRTACFGQCPVYKVEIFKDGIVKYKGTAYIKKRGQHEATASMAFIKNIQQKATAIDYMALSDKYPKGDNMITDIPSTISYVRIDNEGKMVINNYDAPKELIEFERWLEKEIDSLEWKEVKP